MSLFGQGLGKICGVVAAESCRQMAKLTREALRETSTVELRLDWLENDQEREKFLANLKRAGSGKAVLLATCRRRIGGGEFSGDAGAELGMDDKVSAKYHANGLAAIRHPADDPA